MRISAILQNGGQLFLTPPFLLRQAEATRAAEEAEAELVMGNRCVVDLEIHDGRS